jgi:hypothetical protein
MSRSAATAAISILDLATRWTRPVENGNHICSSAPAKRVYKGNGGCNGLRHLACRPKDIRSATGWNEPTAAARPRPRRALFVMTCPLISNAIYRRHSLEAYLWDTMRAAGRELGIEPAGPSPWNCCPAGILALSRHNAHWRSRKKSWVQVTCH